MDIKWLGINGTRNYSRSEIITCICNFPCFYFQETPKTSRCLGVFGLSLYTQERDLKEVFSRYGPVEDIQVVYDHQTGRSRGFAFLYMKNMEDAMEVRSKHTASVRLSCSE